jgi:hypothetical protein
MKLGISPLIFVSLINNQNSLIMVHLTNKFRNANLKAQGLIAFISLMAYFISSYFLEKSYALSKFPVPYFEQQTSFNATKMKKWYAYMTEQNTFDIYLKTQFIDFLFIATVIVAGFTLWTFVANLHSKGTFFHKWGYKLALALPLAGAFDILENLVSFFMIANPLEFANSLIIPYSTFAVIKFGFWTVGLVGLTLSIIMLIINRIFTTKKLMIAGILMLGFTSSGFSQNQKTEKDFTEIIYFEADPFAYINKGYSLHLGYENWGWRFDLTKVKVDFPLKFEEAFYHTKEFDLVTNINGFKVDYIGNRTNWTKGAFVGLDVNHQKLSFEHRNTKQSKDLSAFNIGIRAGYKIPIFKGFYVTPWAAIWKNVSAGKEFSVGSDKIVSNEWDWITTLHFGYVIKL